MIFNSMWERKNDNKPLSVPKISKYIYDSVVYRPCSKDENGKLINDTRFDLVVKGQKTKLQDYVQSFEDEADIYKILERCARSGDYSVLVGDPAYGDCTPFSSDRAVNDKTLNDLQKQSADMPKEVAEALFANLSNDEILAIIQNLNKKEDTVSLNSTNESEVKDNA